MKKLLGMGLLLTLITSGAFANCRSHLYGKWVLTDTSRALDSSLEAAEAPMAWTFTESGRATIDMPPFLHSTNDFECNGNEIVIKKTVPAKLDIVRLINDKLVWKEVGGSKYFYFSKR
ncbi:hypothetical protein QQM79_06110 [Marinobacteraceae bacterium S3BR75-40.1]